MGEKKPFWLKTLFTLPWEKRPLTSAERSSVLACALAGAAVFVIVGIARTLQDDRALRWLLFSIWPVLGIIWGFSTSYVHYKSRRGGRFQWLLFASVATFMATFMLFLLSHLSLLARIAASAFMSLSFLVTCRVLSLPENLPALERVGRYVLGALAVFVMSIFAAYLIPEPAGIEEPAWLSYIRAFFVPLLVFVSLDTYRRYGLRRRARVIVARAGAVGFVSVLVVGVLFGGRIVSEAHFWVGMRCFIKEQRAYGGSMPPSARCHWELALALNPRNLKARYWLLMCRQNEVLTALGRKHYGKAVKMAEDLVRFAPEFFEVYETLFLARRPAGDLEGAAASLERAIAIYRDTPIAKLSRQVMRSLWPTESGLRKSLAGLYYDMGRYPDAFEEVKQTFCHVTGTGPFGLPSAKYLNRAEALLIGKTLWQLGHKGEAETYFREALELTSEELREQLEKELRELGWEPSQEPAPQADQPGPPLACVQFSDAHEAPGKQRTPTPPLAPNCNSPSEKQTAMSNGKNTMIRDRNTAPPRCIGVATFEWLIPDAHRDTGFTPWGSSRGAFLPQHASAWLLDQRIHP